MAWPGHVSCGAMFFAPLLQSGHKVSVDFANPSQRTEFLKQEFISATTSIDDAAMYHSVYSAAMSEEKFEEN